MRNYLNVFKIILLIFKILCMIFNLLFEVRDGCLVGLQGFFTFGVISFFRKKITANITVLLVNWFGIMSEKRETCENFIEIKL